MIAVCKERLANYKVPKRVFFVDELPRNAMGKVQKNLLRDQHKDLFATMPPTRICNSSPGIDMSAEVSMRPGRPGRCWESRYDGSERQATWL